MISKYDGGSAYPVICDGDPNIIMHSEGMSLRDYFAGEALIGIFSNAKMMTTVDNSVGSFKEGSEKISEACVAYADALIKELNK